jgi:hypothetical protein
MNSQETIRHLNNLKTSNNVKFFVVRDKAGNAVSLPSNYRKRNKFLWNRKCDIMLAYNYYFKDKQVVKDLFASRELRIQEFAVANYSGIPEWFLNVKDEVILNKKDIDSELAKNGYVNTNKVRKTNTEVEEIKSRIARIEREIESFGHN